MSAWRSKGKLKEKSSSSLSPPSFSSSSFQEEKKDREKDRNNNNNNTIERESKRVSLYEHYGIGLRQEIDRDRERENIFGIGIHDQDGDIYPNTNTRGKGNKVLVLLTKIITENDSDYDSSLSSSTINNKNQNNKKISNEESVVKKVIMEYKEQVKGKHVIIGNLEKLEAEIKDNYVKGMELFNKIIIVHNNKRSQKEQNSCLALEEQKNCLHSHLDMDIIVNDEQNNDYEKKKNYYQDIQDTIKYLEQVQILATYVPYFVRHKKQKNEMSEKFQYLATKSLGKLYADIVQNNEKAFHQFSYATTLEDNDITSWYRLGCLSTQLGLYRSGRHAFEKISILDEERNHFLSYQKLQRLQNFLLSTDTVVPSSNSNTFINDVQEVDISGGKGNNSIEHIVLYLKKKTLWTDLASVLVDWLNTGKAKHLYSSLLHPKYDSLYEQQGERQQGIEQNGKSKEDRINKGKEYLTESTNIGLDSFRKETNHMVTMCNSEKGNNMIVHNEAKDDNANEENSLQKNANDNNINIEDEATSLPFEDNKENKLAIIIETFTVRMNEKAWHIAEKEKEEKKRQKEKEKEEREKKRLAQLENVSRLTSRRIRDIRTRNKNKDTLMADGSQMIGTKKGITSSAETTGRSKFDLGSHHEELQEVKEDLNGSLLEICNSLFEKISILKEQEKGINDEGSPSDGNDSLLITFKDQKNKNDSFSTEDKAFLQRIGKILKSGYISRNAENFIQRENSNESKEQEIKKIVSKLK